VDVAPAIGLLGLLLVKEAGLPIPVPGDLLVIGAGVAAAGTGFAALALLVAILIAGFVGGTIQFLLIRGALRSVLLRILHRAGLPEARIEGLADWLRRRGARGVATARATPAVRVGAIAASGIAALPLPSFVAGLVVGNSLFVSAHFLLGFVIGPPAIALVSASSGPILGLVALVVVAVIGALGWRSIGARRAAGRRASRPAAGSEAAGEWTALPSMGIAAWVDAACPACIAISLVGGNHS
jgi:membrane-associated protein